MADLEFLVQAPGHIQARAESALRPCGREGRGGGVERVRVGGLVLRAVCAAAGGFGGFF